MTLKINLDGTMSRERKDACAHCGSWTACDQCARWTQFGVMRCPACRMSSAVWNAYGAYTGRFVCQFCGLES